MAREGTDCRRQESPRLAEGTLPFLSHTDVGNKNLGQRWSMVCAVTLGTKELPIVRKKQLTLGCKGLDTDDMYCYKQAVILSLLFMPYVSCSFALKCHWINFNFFVTFSVEIFPLDRTFVPLI